MERWILLSFLAVWGYYNVHRSAAKKLDRNRLSTSMRGFNSFIEEYQLKDIPFSNTQLTWSISLG